MVLQDYSLKKERDHTKLNKAFKLEVFKKPHPLFTCLRKTGEVVF